MPSQRWNYVDVTCLICNKELCNKYFLRQHLINSHKTTIDEYKQIEKDPALERRFQPVFVNEPTKDETFKILQIGRAHV